MSRSHSFSVDVAGAYDVDTALMLQHICFWYLKVVSDNVNKHKNEYWVRMKLTQMQAQFPYWGVSKIRHLVDKMIASGLLKKGEFNDKKNDRTKWYTLTKKSKKILNISTLKATAEIGNNTTAEIDSPTAEIDNSKYKEVDIKGRYIIIKEKLQGNIGLLESIAINNKLKISVVQTSIISFVLEQQEISKFYQNDTDLYRHFRYWVPKQSFSKNNLETEIEWFIETFNKISKRDFKITETVKQRFAKQFQVGYSGADMRKAIANLYSSSVGNKFHINNQFKFATPEYLLKEDNLNKYLNFKVA